jgi:hypothetical protein
MLAAGLFVTWLGGLWLLDLRFGTFRAPWQHLGHILDYGLTLRHPVPMGIESAPWQWLANDVQIPYLEVDQVFSSGGQLVDRRPTVLFRGAMNPLVIGAAPLFAGWAAWMLFRTGDRLAAWALSWLAATYLPYYPLALLGHRITYLYYFLPTLPAVAAAGALCLRRLPIPATLAYMAAVLVGFAALFPFRDVPP